MKKQPIDSEKISVSHESDKGLMSKELVQLNGKKNPNNSILKVGREP